LIIRGQGIGLARLDGTDFGHRLNTG
jgi:hypothetical protein